MISQEHILWKHLQCKVVVQFEYLIYVVYTHINVNMFMNDLFDIWQHYQMSHSVWIIIMTNMWVYHIIVWLDGNI